MLRTVLLTSLALVATFAALPVAEADHYGPCGHEYAEAVLWFALDHHSAKRLLWDVGACVDGTVWWVCDGLIACTLP